MSSADRTPEEIASDIAETRNRLAGTIDELVYRAQPKTIIRRQTEALKAKFVDENGSPKTDAIVKVAGAVVGFVVVIVAIRKLTS